jgi:hypothetical protein
MIVHLRDSIFKEIGRAGLVAGGALAAIFAAFWMRRKFTTAHRMQARPAARSVRARQMRQMLGHAVIGNTSNAILSILGPPRSSAGFSSTIPPNAKDAFLRANTWYYVLDNTERRAMVIEFENGIARSAEFIHGVTPH